MKRQPPAALLARLPALLSAVLLGTAGCSSALLPQALTSDRSVAEVTGFKSAPQFGGSPDYGPVTVRLTGAAATRLAQLVSQLPAIPESQVDCMDGWGLTYRMTFSTGSVPRSEAFITGYACDAAVSVSAGSGGTSWRRDVSCKLFRAVRQVLPARAKATLQDGVGCNI